MTLKCAFFLTQHYVNVVGYDSDNMSVDVQKYSGAQADCCGSRLGDRLQVWCQESATFSGRAACDGSVQV